MVVYSLLGRLADAEDGYNLVRLAHLLPEMTGSGIIMTFSGGRVPVVLMPREGGCMELIVRPVYEIG